MKWGSAVSRHAETEPAILDVIERAERALGEPPIELVLLFLSSQHTPAALRVAEVLADRFPDAVRIGCSGNSCIGGGVEVEDGPSISLTLAHLPDVSLHPFHVSPQTLATAEEGATDWGKIVGVDSDAQPAFVVLGDPFTGDSERLIRGLELAYPGAVQIGGLASGGQQPGSDVLLLGDRILSEGHVGLSLTGDVVIDTVVAQGCRPIGEPMFVTRCDQNVIFEVDGRPPLEVLNELAAKANERERRLLQTSLFIGLQMDRERAELGRGDFLVRNITGADPESGSLAIGALVRETWVVQFQLRDGETAAEDLKLRLSEYRSDLRRARSALLFSCLGRGRHIYDSENHDSNLLKRYLGDVSVSGFFCNGEIGPVEGRTFLHGYTSAFGIFRPKGQLDGSSNSG